jgi:uncharacterized NAD(P)/FAD-binding protein YdhS
MTPEDAARFILSDCQDPTLKAQCEREQDEAFAEAMKDPQQKARWEAHIRAFADEIDKRIAAEVAEIYRA